MIPKSTHHCVIRDGIIVAKGSKKDMERYRKKEGGTIGIGFNDPIGTDVSARLPKPLPKRFGLTRQEWSDAVDYAESVGMSDEAFVQYLQTFKNYKGT